MRRSARRHHGDPLVSPGDFVTPGCSGKRSYFDQATAKRMAKRTRRQHECKVAEYKCRHCHLWHVGER